MLPIIIGSLFSLTLSYLYLRFPVQMWNRFLRPAIGGVVVSEGSGLIISRVIGGVAGVVGIGLIAAMSFGLLHVKH